MEKPICKICNKGFNEWTLFSSCDNCDDGIAESDNWLWDGSHYISCKKCNGTGEIETRRNDFCSEECIDEYFTNDNN